MNSANQINPSTYAQPSYHDYRNSAGAGTKPSEHEGATSSSGNLPFRGTKRKADTFLGSTEERQALDTQYAVLSRYQNRPVNERRKEWFLEVTTNTIEKCGAQAAFQCLQHLKDLGIAPNYHIYSAVISACGKNDQIQRAIDHFNQIKEEGILPNLLVYKALISVCKKGGKLDLAIKYFNEMNEAGFKPDLITYNTVISAYAEHGDTESAVEYFKKMKEAEIKPDEVTYSAVISACKNADQADTADTAFEMLRSAVDDNIFQATLGYDNDKKSLDLHGNAVYADQSLHRREPGIPALVASAIFYFHHKEGNITEGTRIIVGQHGDNSLKPAIQSCLAKRKLGYAEDRFPDGNINDEYLIVKKMPRKRQIHFL